MEHLPLISIVIPVYNTSLFLNRCLNSCLSQKYVNLEIIAVNDGSTDNSLDVLLEYEHIDKRVRIINKENEGLILTRKRGLSESNGEFILFVDSDDYLPESSVDVLYSWLCEYNADVAIGRMCYFWDNGKVLIKDNYYPLGESDIELYASLILGRIGGNVSGTLIRKKLLCNAEFSPSLIVGEDLSVQMQLRNLSQKICYISDVVYYYYQNVNSIMHKQSEKILKSHIEFCKWQIKYVSSLSYGEHSLIQGALAYSVLNGLFAFIFNGGYQKDNRVYIDMVNSNYLQNQYAKENLPVYVYASLRLNSLSRFLGTFLIRSMYYLRALLK